MSTVIWEDPPMDGRSKYPHAEWAALLREKPNTWAKLLDCETSGQAANLVTQIRNGLIKAYSPKGTFEAAIRKASTYARYIGPVEEKVDV